MGKKKGKKKAEPAFVEDDEAEAAYWAMIDASGSPEPEPEIPEPASDSDNEVRKTWAPRAPRVPILA
jgi:hypothetical protein